jgi:hypothetical protein
MSQLLRSATPMPVVPRQPGGAIVRAASPGGLVHSPGGAVTPWMQRIKTGATAGRILAAPAVAAVAGPAAGLSIGLGLGGAILGSMGRPGTARMSLLGGDAVPSARKPYYGPAFGDPGGNPQVGGGNAGASLASQWSPTAQQNPRLPAGRNVAIVNPPQRAQNRALNIAAQNAGLPAWNWQADENSAMLESAQARGTAAAAAREAQGGRGYITADSMPASLDQSKADYWQGADMAAWAAANPELARRAQERAGFTPAAMGAGGAWSAPTSEQAILTAQGAGALDGLMAGATTDDAIRMGQAAGAFDQGIAGGSSLLGNPPPPRSAGVVDIGPASNGGLYGQQLRAMEGTSGAGPLADAETYGRMLTPAEEQRRRAGELTDAYLRAIKGGIQGMGR